MADMMGMGATARHRRSALGLMAQALGTPQQALDKVVRLLEGLAIYGNRRELQRRLGLLRARGLIDGHPTRAQLFFGGFDMLRFFITPGAMDYIKGRGLNFTFHQVLRILEEPLSMTDPIGLLSTQDNIIGHLMQVVHADASYDLALLEMFSDGLDEMERQCAAMLAGDHPRHASISAIVEDPGYHARLLEFVRAHRRRDRSVSLVRDNLSRLMASDPEYSLAARQFAELPSAFRYFSRLPRSWGDGLAHFRAHDRIDQRLLDPALRDPKVEGTRA